ncbi:acetoacetate decarboxylase family protein [Nocardia sp. NPDC003482]
MRLHAVRGIPETDLDDRPDDEFPERVPPAPWRNRCVGLIWLSRPSPDTPTTLPPGTGRPLTVLNALIDYRETPVGGYHEILAAPMVRVGARMRFNCPFISVDSKPSLVAGRENWALPKVLAEFRGDLADAETVTATSTSGVRWRVSARIRAFGPAVPMSKKFTIWQPFPDGELRRIPARLSGRARAAVVRIDVESDRDLPNLVRPGRHAGLLVDPLLASLLAPCPTA